MLIRNKFNGFSFDGSRRAHLDLGGGGGGGSPAPVQQTVNQTNIPPYAEPYVTDMLGRAEALTTQSQYQPYAGQRVAGFTPMQAQAFQNIANQQVAGQIGEASNLASQVGRTALGAFGQGQELGQVGLGYGASGAGYGAQGAGIGQLGAALAGRGVQYGEQGAGYGSEAAAAARRAFEAQQAYETKATSPEAQQAFMSPYMQNVVDFQKQQATRDYDIAAQTRKAQAVKAGAFGGSRQAVAEAEANRALMNQLAGIQATGSQKAFEDAQKQMMFGAELGLRGLGTGYQGLGMGIQGTQAGMQGLGAAQEAYRTGLQGTAQGMQGAQTGLQGVGQAISAGQYGLAGLAQAGSAASTLGALGQTQFGQESAINQALASAGAQQQALQQRGLDLQYQDYLDSMNYPYKQLGFMSDMFRGLPLGQTSSTMYQAAPSTASQLAGAGAAIYGASKLFKEGGSVNKHGSGLADLALHKLVG